MKQVKGGDVLCSLEDLGAFLPQEPCFGHHSVGPVPRWWGGDIMALQSSKIPVLAVFSAFPRMILVCSTGHHS